MRLSDTNANNTGDVFDGDQPIALLACMRSLHERVCNEIGARGVTGYDQHGFLIEREIVFSGREAPVVPGPRPWPWASRSVTRGKYGNACRACMTRDNACGCIIAVISFMIHVTELDWENEVNGWRPRQTQVLTPLISAPGLRHTGG